MFVNERGAMADTAFFRKQNRGQPKAVLFGFGKHPAWAEHQLKLGESSEGLLLLRDRLYWDGILKHLSSWESLPPESRCEFDHWLVWARPGNVVLGRLVASADAAGRKAVPFIVVAEVSGCPLELVLRRMPAALEEFVQRCHKLTNPKAVEAAFASQQGALESLATNDSASAEPLALSSVERAAFAALPDWDPEGVALARLLYKVESSWAAFAPGRDGKAPKSQAGVAIRLPSLPSQLAASVLLWEEFVHALVHQDVPRLYVVPATRDWLDLVVGEFEANHFAGLQANRQRMGLETQVPHTTGLELQAHATALMAAWRTGAPLPMPDRSAPSSSATDTTTQFFRKTESKPEPAADSAQPQTAQAKSGGGKKLAWLLVLAAMVLLAGCWWFFNSSKSSVGPQTVAARQPAEAAVAPEIAEPKEPPSLEEGGKEQTVELALKVQPNHALANLKLEATVEPAGRLDVRPSFSAGHWQLVLTPRAAGAAMVRVTATDDHGLAGKPVTFPISIAAPPFVPSVSRVPAQTLEIGQPSVDLPIQLVVDPKLKAEAVQIAAKAENPSIADVSAKSDGGRRQLTLVPKAPGKTLVSVTATDDRGRMSEPMTFDVNVAAPPAVPEVARLQDQTLEIGQPALNLSLALKVDERLSLNKVQVLAKADDASIVDVTVIPGAGQWNLALEARAPGKALVTVTAKDERGRSSSPMRFGVQVQAKFALPRLEIVGDQILQQGQPATNIPLSLTMDSRLEPGRARIEAKADPANVVLADPRFVQGKWQVALAPQSPGTAAVSLVPTDQRGSAGEPVSFGVTVTEAPRPDPPSASNPPAQAAPNTAPTGQSFGQQQREQLTAKLKAFQVWFGDRKPDPAIKNPPNFPDPGAVAKPLEGLPIPTKRSYRDKVLALQAEFKKAALLTPENERTFNRLIDEITTLQ
jgi:hypothetical protein